MRLRAGNAISKPLRSAFELPEALSTGQGFGGLSGRIEEFRE